MPSAGVEGFGMSDKSKDHNRFYTAESNWTDISSRQVQPPPGRNVRHASEVMETEPGPVIVEARDEVCLRWTERTRTLVKATFLEDDRSIKTLSLSRYTDRQNPEERTVISLKDAEVDELLGFIQRIRSVSLASPGQSHFQGGRAESKVTDDEARRLFESNPAVFSKLVEQGNLAEDVVAVGYRRSQLTKFQELLTSPDAFAAEKSRLDCRPEDVWQRFFEANTWIFGYGLSYQFRSGLNGRTLEQVVRGFSMADKGKRADGVMKTRGALASLCFVEIKRHDTKLLEENTYRSGAWQPSKQLTGGVAQVHATVQAALENLRDEFKPEDDLGDPTGEVLYNFAPRSFLVIGSLNEFEAEHGPSKSKFRSFELYRRHIWRPEIITFDELLERARFIVEQA